MKPIIGVLLIQGLGNSKIEEAQKIEAQLRSELEKVSPGLGADILFEPVDYQTDIQHTQQVVWERMEEAGLRWNPMRRFCLHYLSDATSYQHHPEQSPNTYSFTHNKILSSIRRLKTQAGDRPLIPVVLAGSLGCMIISNYLWDAQASKYMFSKETEMGKKAGTLDATDGFLDLELFISWGCNIPLFVSSLPVAEPIRIPPQSNDFRWYNYYDKDDVLGWPLKPLSASYGERVTEDIEFNVGITPLGHTKYWSKPNRMARKAAKRILNLWNRNLNQSVPLAA